MTVYYRKHVDSMADCDDFLEKELEDYKFLLRERCIDDMDAQLMQVVRV